MISFCNINIFIAYQNIMAKYLVTFTDQINDVEITGFRAMTDKEVELLESLAYSIKWSFSYPLTHLTLEYANGDDNLTRLDFKEITNEEYKVLNKMFCEPFGVFIDEDFLKTLVEDEEDFEIDDDYFDDEFEEEDDF